MVFPPQRFVHMCGKIQILDHHRYQFRTLGCEIWLSTYICIPMYLHTNCTQEQYTMLIYTRSDSLLQRPLFKASASSIRPQTQSSLWFSHRSLRYAKFCNLQQYVLDRILALCNDDLQQKITWRAIIKENSQKKKNVNFFLAD